MNKVLKNSWHYVVGDIHGCYQEFLKLETKIFDHAKKNKKKPIIVSVGDIIDRGPCSKEVTEHFIEGRRKGTHDVVLGNHEAMMLASLQLFKFTPPALDMTLIFLDLMVSSKGDN